MTISYEDGSYENIDIINDVSFDCITPAILFEQHNGTSDYNGVYRGYVNPIYNGEILNVGSMVYIDIKGDATPDGDVNISDATNALTYFANNSAGLDIKLVDNADENYEKLAFFLADVDTKSTIGQNSDAGELLIKDATNILTYFADSSAGLNPQWNEIIPSLSLIPNSLWEYKMQN